MVEGLKGREVLYVALRSAMIWLRVLDPWVIRSTADAAGAVVDLTTLAPSTASRSRRSVSILVVRLYTSISPYMSLVSWDRQATGCLGGFFHKGLRFMKPRLDIFLPSNSSLAACRSSHSITGQAHASANTRTRTHEHRMIWSGLQADTPAVHAGK